MEIQLIIGPNNSGKSLYAETLATQYQKAPLYYLATMVPQNHENLQRIEKHKLQRAGKGFHTIEEPWEIHKLSLPSDSVVLLEDASNLLANGIFIHHADGKACLQRIFALAEQCRTLIIVSIAGLTPGEYDEETNRYIQELNTLNQALEENASKCIHF